MVDRSNDRLTMSPETASSHDVAAKIDERLQTFQLVADIVFSTPIDQFAVAERIDGTRPFTILNWSRRLESYIWRGSKIRS